MKKREITVLTDACLLTCIVQRGLGETIVKAARNAGAQGATVFYARGSGVRERLGVLGVALGRVGGFRAVSWRDTFIYVLICSYNIIYVLMWSYSFHTIFVYFQ